MSPSTAIQLVERYARLTKEIKLRTREIGENLDKCNGVSGQRLEPKDEFGIPLRQPELDEKNRDKDLHLWGWYQPDIVDDGCMSRGYEWLQVGSLEAEECPHCYAAHLAVQARKQARKQLGAVKGAMARAA